MLIDHCQQLILILKSKLSVIQDFLQEFIPHFYSKVSQRHLITANWKKFLPIYLLGSVVIEEVGLKATENLTIAEFFDVVD